MARQPGESEPAPADRAIEVLQRDGGWVTCRDRAGIVWKLDSAQYVDGEILAHGVFEPESTQWVRKFLKPGMTVIDVGANFGYYTIQFSRLVGPTGEVHAFEPTTRFRIRLMEHVESNHCANVTVVPSGLSDTCQRARIALGGDSATLHWPDDRKVPVGSEDITLITLDQYAGESSLNRLDFIKVDIDGHEPQFLAGAGKTLLRFRPMMLMEFMQLALMRSGAGVQSLAGSLKRMGYQLHSERTGRPFPTETDFLVEAMNCSHSTNILCVPSV
jgi:FkbM family methyltransferase